MAEMKWDVSRLSTGERSALKRNAGIPMGNSLQALEAFYHAVPIIPKGIQRESQWYACLCMQCLWKPEDHPAVIRYEEILRRLYMNADTSDSIRNRIINMLDQPWSEDGFLLGKLNNFSHMFRSGDASLMPDFDALADDLARWNHPDKPVQRRWIRTICGSIKEETENKELNKEENKNAD